METLALMEEIFLKKSKDGGTVAHRVLPSTKELPDITLQLALKTSMFDEPKSPFCCRVLPKSYLDNNDYLKAIRMILKPMTVKN